jgi:hypothetical protein
VRFCAGAHKSTLDDAPYRAGRLRRGATVRAFRI